MWEPPRAMDCGLGAGYPSQSIGISHRVPLRSHRHTFDAGTSSQSTGATDRPLAIPRAKTNIVISRFAKGKQAHLMVCCTADFTLPKFAPTCSVPE